MRINLPGGVEVVVDTRSHPDHGAVFFAVLNGIEYTGTTYDALKDKVQRAHRESTADVEIPLWSVLLDSGRSYHLPGPVRPVIVRGEHGRNGHLLVTWQDTGKKEQISGYYLPKFFATESAAEAYRQASIAVYDARTALDKLTRETSVDARDLVSKAIQAAVNKEDTGV